MAVGRGCSVWTQCFGLGSLPTSEAALTGHRDVNIRIQCCLGRTLYFAQSVKITRDHQLLGGLTWGPPSSLEHWRGRAVRSHLLHWEVHFATILSFQRLLKS